MKLQIHTQIHTCNCWGWAKLKSEAWNSFWVSHKSGRVQNTSSVSPRVHIRRKLEAEAALGLEPRNSNMVYRHSEQHLIICPRLGFLRGMEIIKQRGDLTYATTGSF